MQLGNFAPYLIDSIVEVIRLIKRSILFNRVFTARLLEITSVIHSCLDLPDLLLVEPLNALTVLPQPIFNLLLIGKEVSSKSMLLSPVPVTLVAATINPCVNSESVFLIIFVLTLVHSTVTPLIDTVAFHITFKPFTFKASSI